MKYIAFFLILGVGWISYQYGGLINSSTQIEIYDSILSVSAIIFGVMGAWVAIIYPDALAKVFKSKANLDENLESVKRLFIPMRTSTVIVALSTLVKWIVPVMRKVEWIVHGKEMFLAISFFILGLMILSLIWSLILTFIPMEMAGKLIHDKTEVAKGLDRKRGNAKIISKIDGDKS